MLALSLVAILTSALVADLSPEELIGRLDSPDRVVREEATRTLEERGVEALSALRDARTAAQEPETRESFADLIARIEARTLDRPSMVKLDVDDRPLGDAVNELASRSGFSIMLDGPALADRQVTARASDPLRFWEAVDRLGRAGHVHHDPGPRRDRFGNDPQASTIRLVDGDPSAFTAYSGPLRIHLFATHHHLDLDFRASRSPRTLPKQAAVSVEVQAFAEPGRFVNSNGLPRLEAVDPQGRAIVAAPGGEGGQASPFERSWLTPGSLSLLHWQLSLGLPDLPPRSPLKLRGVLPVVLSSRRPDPLVIPLADATGKTFRQGRSLVRIEAVTSRPPRTTDVILMLREEGTPTDRPRISEGPEPDYLGDFLPNRLEFQDAKGHALSWLLLGNRAAPTPSGELKVQVMVAGQVPPDRLLVFRLNRLVTEIPFEFEEVPSP